MWVDHTAKQAVAVWQRKAASTTNEPTLPVTLRVSGLQLGSRSGISHTSSRLQSSTSVGLKRRVISSLAPGAMLPPAGLSV